MDGEDKDEGGEGCGGRGIQGQGQRGMWWRFCGGGDWLLIEPRRWTGNTRATRGVVDDESSLDDGERQGDEEKKGKGAVVLEEVPMVMNEGEVWLRRRLGYLVVNLDMDEIEVADASANEGGGAQEDGGSEPLGADNHDAIDVHPRARNGARSSLFRAKFVSLMGRSIAFCLMLDAWGNSSFSLCDFSHWILYLKFLSAAYEMSSCFLGDAYGHTSFATNQTEVPMVDHGVNFYGDSQPPMLISGDDIRQGYVLLTCKSRTYKLGLD
ncbi:hypothetical protein Droror1_Dr00002850 [Drosera rotundifolia]